MANDTITMVEYDALKSQQSNQCAICGFDASKEPIFKFRGTPASLQIDQDSRTGSIRGLLCERCLRLLSIAGEDATLLSNMATYLNAK